MTLRRDQREGRARHARQFTVGNAVTTALRVERPAPMPPHIAGTRSGWAGMEETHLPVAPKIHPTSSIGVPHQRRPIPVEQWDIPHDHSQIPDGRRLILHGGQKSHYLTAPSRNDVFLSHNHAPKSHLNRGNSPNPRHKIGIISCFADKSPDLASYIPCFGRRGNGARGAEFHYLSVA
jgi:hypothetical protein